MKLIFELPKYIPYCGGVAHTLRLAEEMGADVRFQRPNPVIPPLKVKYTTGPTEKMPPCDCCITYSDTPHIDQLMALPQIKQKAILMLSYNMAPQREKKNIKTPGLIVMASSQRTASLIKNDGGQVNMVGHGFDMEQWSSTGIERKPYVAIMYHPAAAKNYNMACVVADKLCRMKFAKGVVSFGIFGQYLTAPKPEYLVLHWQNASQEEVRNIFSECKVYLMPSSSEGYNLSPVEATLCGCASVICDGDIGGVFRHLETCAIAEPNSDASLYKEAKALLQGTNNFEKNMRAILKDDTYTNTAKRIMECLLQY